MCHMLAIILDYVFLFYFLEFVFRWSRERRSGTKVLHNFVHV